MLWGAADALRTEIGIPLPHYKREAYDSAVAAQRIAIGDTAFSAAWAKGSCFTLEEATALAVDRLPI